MKLLSRENFNRVGEHIAHNARELEKARFHYLFGNGSSKEVIDELKKFQNRDGGFGNGLESDFILPDSTPMATLIAFQILDEINDISLAADLIKGGVNYFEREFNKKRNGWYAVSAKVNNYPHAPWWHFNEAEGMTVIDKSWGNPTAEILGYLYKYRSFVNELEIDSLIKYAEDYFINKENINSEHEVYCFLSLYKNLPNENRVKIEGKLTEAIQGLVNVNTKEWDNYVPRPVNFVKDPYSKMFGIKAEDIDTNLDYLIDMLSANGYIMPNWQWGQYDESWEVAKKNWIGVLTLGTLVILNNFNRIEG